METLQPISQLAITYFLVTNPIGNSPTILALVKDFDFKRQKQIMLREGFFALIIALVFQFFGEYILKLLHVDVFSLTLCGGILLFLVALGMIFPDNDPKKPHEFKQEPFFVPIATPLLSGPGLMTIIMLTAASEQNSIKITGAILLAWTGVLAVMIAAPYLQRILGRRGLVALEQVMGLILTLIAIEMILKGAGAFVKTLS